MLALTLLMATVTTETKPLVIPLWPKGAPGSESRRSERETRPHPWSIANIHNPSLTVYLPPKGKANGTAVVIAPGGGHRELVIDEEGTKPAKLLNSLGITAFVLRYRLVNEEGSKLNVDRDTRADTYRAMRLLRTRATDWGIDPTRIGMMGFSAGGEVLNMAVFGEGLGDPHAPDPVDRADERPNFGIWIYPGPFGIPATVPKTSPPGFMLVASDDGLTGVVLNLAGKYHAAKVPMEVHILASGGHGFNMGDRFPQNKAVNTWPKRLTDWLSDSGLLKRKA